MNTLIVGAVLLCAGLGLTTSAGRENPHWVCCWGGSPQLTEPGNMPPNPGLADSTLRQVVHLSLGSNRFRFHFSNAYGTRPLTLMAVHIAQSAGSGKIDVATDTPLAFGGQPSVTIPPGAEFASDPVKFDAKAITDVMVTIRVQDATRTITGHPGARCTSYITAGDHVSDASLPDAVPVQHWYYISALDAQAPASSATVAIIGDSITDGRGSTTDENRRWPDFLARRLQADKVAHRIAIVNQGIGGNRILNDGLGPSVMARFDRDVIGRAGVKWVVLFEGINDFGTKSSAQGPGRPAQEIANDLIAAYSELINRAHDHGIKAIGATITPCGESFYFSPELEAARQSFNKWIRTSGKFDAVFDFDKAIQDPNTPTKLRAEADSGDHLHLSDEGYRLLAESIDIGFFA
ncbi:MAG: SGNH/GDSL hydrolase family protein [Armatimonadetes bacterium]|nr:SGNH/GDSL hydrolase family protein [Armatimonadota bacterium]